MARVSDPIRILTEKAKEVKEHAEAMAGDDVDEGDEEDEEDEEGDDGDEGGDSVENMLLESANEAVKACERIKTELEHAQATIKEYTTEAEKAFIELAKLARVVLTRDNSEKGLERVEWLVSKARALASQGEISTATASASEAEAEVLKITQAETELLSARRTTYDLLLKLQLGDRWPPKF
ncbi:hypothetical protein GQ44DRAFT_780582 [Phaeosphaeriaceae sp. PMI808]|nr:hypothetical protein GQ44DRAFT_780582 [Phaeosphaeriaceae sp. PMI808]